MNKYVQLIFDIINNFIKKINNNEELCLLVNNFQVNEKLKNHVLMNVISVNKVSLDISNGTSYIMQGEKYILQQKPENYQLLIAFHSMFMDEKFYKGFEILSQISSFIDNNKEFSGQNVPQIIEQNLDSFFFNSKIFTLEEENSIWNRLKTPYMPTIFYEVGLLPIFSPIKFNERKIAPLKHF